jgi:hypothetical protein
VLQYRSEAEAKQAVVTSRYATKLASPAISYTTTVYGGVSTFAWLIVPTRIGAPSNAVASVSHQNATHVVVTVDYEMPAIGRVQENVTVEVPTPAS